MKVAVVGCGPGGLVSIHQLKKGITDVQVVGYEINEDVGGAWFYTDESGIDEYGVPYTSSMYKGLRANLPKQVMQFSDYPTMEKFKTFMKYDKFLEYIHSYVDHYDIRRHIKFRHMVTAVKFNNNNKWDVTVKNLPTGVVETETFEYVFVCTGHNSHPFVPTYPGIDKFQGTCIHSHDYRKPEVFKDKTVLTIGMGPSAMDITMELLPHARKVIASYRKIVSPVEGVHKKPTIREFGENSVVFDDGTTETIDSVIYCTGYAFYCPFLDSNTGLTVEPTHIDSLYRHIVNVEHPKMYFIGFVKYCCIIPMVDMQARYCVALMKGDFKLPTKELMLENINVDYESKDKSKVRDPKSVVHNVGPSETMYYCALAKESGVETVPLIYHAMRSNVRDRAMKDLMDYRNYDYTFGANNTFTVRRIGSDMESEPIYCDVKITNRANTLVNI